MAGVMARDASAFEALFDRYHRFVFAVALRLLGDRGKAEDATQAVFLKLWSSPEAFRGGNFAAWLGRVARNRCLDSLRGAIRHPSATLEESGSGETLEDAAFERLDAQAVHQALAALPEDQRSLIELAFFGGLTQHHIAERTGLPLGTVKSRVRAGMLRLRSALEGSVRE